MQKTQRETGKSFVSRTQLNPKCWEQLNTIVFRVVLANPLTTHDILHSVLDEQRKIVQQAPNLMRQIEQMAQSILSA